MNRKTILIPLLLLLALLVAGPAEAQGDGSVAATLEVSPGDHSVGDPIQLQLVIDHPDDSHVIIPELEENWGNFLVYSQSPAETIQNENGSKATTQLIDVRLFAPGEFMTPPMPYTVVGSDGQLADMTIDPITVAITSVLVEGDEALRDIKPQAELSYLAILPWIIAAVAISGIALAAFLFIRRRRAALAEPAIDARLPHEVALDRLFRIEKLDLPGDGHFKEHYTMVSDTVRIYVEMAFHIPVMERTTAEIQHNIKQTTISPSIARQFLSLLDESDLVKFSKFAPDVPSARQALQLGRLIVEETIPASQPDSASGSPGSLVNAPGSTSDPTLSVNGNYRQSEVRA